MGKGWGWGRGERGIGGGGAENLSAASISATEKQCLPNHREVTGSVRPPLHPGPVSNTSVGRHPGVDLFLPLKKNRLVGLAVKASASRAEDPGFESRWRRDFSGSSHTSDLKIGTPVATLPGAWRYRVSAGTGWPGVSIL